MGEKLRLIKNVKRTIKVELKPFLCKSKQYILFYLNVPENAIWFADLYLPPPYYLLSHTKINNNIMDGHFCLVTKIHLWWLHKVQIKRPGKMMSSYLSNWSWQFIGMRINTAKDSSELIFLMLQLGQLALLFLINLWLFHTSGSPPTLELF